MECPRHELKLIVREGERLFVRSKRGPIHYNLTRVFTGHVVRVSNARPEETPSAEEENANILLDRSSQSDEEQELEERRSGELVSKWNANIDKLR
jgi:hypothetical protein